MTGNAMNWELRQSHAEEIHRGLDAETVRVGLFRGDYTAEDWVRREGESDWHQLATLDEFAVDVAGTRRRRVRPVEDDDGLDMTPMIDVTFLLLIFFMITASFHLQKGLDFPPDQSESKSTAADQLPGLGQFADRIILEIAEGDRFSLKDPNSGAADGPGQTAGPGAGPNIDPAKLVETLRKLTRDTKKQRVLILAHELASHEAVVLAIDSCGQAGLKDVSLADVMSAPLKTQKSNVIKRD